LTATARLAVALAAALALAGIPALMAGDGVRFAPCAGGGDDACATLVEPDAELRLRHGAGAARVGLPGRLVLPLGAPPEADPSLTRVASLGVVPAGAIPAVLDRIDRPAVVIAAGATAGAAVTVARGAGRVDGVVLVDPGPAALRPDGPPLTVSALVVTSGAPPRALAGLSVRPLVVLRRPGALDRCTRRVLSGFARDPLSPRPEVTDCRR